MLPKNKVEQQLEHFYDSLGLVYDDAGRQQLVDMFMKTVSINIYKKLMEMSNDEEE